MKPLQPTKIKFFQQREAGEKITATFDFLRENRNKWLQLCAWPVIPLALVLGWIKVSTVTFSPVYYSPPLYEIDFIEGIVGVSLKDCAFVSLCSLLILVALWMLFTATSAMMRLYEYRTDRLRGVTWKEWREALLRSSGYSAVVAVAAFLLLYVISQASFLLQVVLILIALPLALLAPACSLGRYGGFLDSSSRALSLGFNTWGGVLATLAGLQVVLFFLRGASEVLTLVLYNFLVQLIVYDGFSPVLSKCIMAFSCAAVYWVSLLCISVLMIAAGYLYGHAEEKTSFISLDDDIRNFENL